MRALALLVLAAAGPLAAEPHPCEGKITQSDLNECSHVAWQQADEALNMTYSEAIAAARQFDGLPEGHVVSTLREAQRAWVAFRDAACEAEAATFDGGSAQPMVRNGCLETLTIRRTEDLKDYAAAVGG